MPNIGWGLLTALVISRTYAPNILDTTVFAKEKKRIFGWFLLGYSLATYIDAIHKNPYKGISNEDHILKVRVSENEQAHALFSTLRAHITRRKLGIWDLNPN